MWLILHYQQIPADTTSAQHCSDIHEDQIMCNWGRKPIDCISAMYRPVEPMSDGFIRKLSEISLIAPGKKGLDAAGELIKSDFDKRCSGSAISFVKGIQEDSLRDTLVKIHQKLAAAGEICKARLQNNTFLRSHGFQSNDPFDWPYDTVMALWALVKSTGGSAAKICDAGRFLERHFFARVTMDSKSPKLIIVADVQHAIDEFTNSSSPDSTPTRGYSVRKCYTLSFDFTSGADVVTQADIGIGAPQQDSGLCTTGSIFHPCLPPLDVLLSVAKAFYNARKQRGAAYGTGDGPTIMSRKVALKGIYNDNKDSEGLGTFLRHDSRNYSYKNLRSNEEAIAALEKKFGEPFCEIFSCPDIQADQALRTSHGFLSELHRIAQTHHIDNSQKLRAIITEYFEKCVGDGKPHILTSAGLQQLATELAKASAPDDDGRKYKGWTSLGGADAPITPTAQPAKQSRRRSRMSSPSGSSQQPDPKKCKPGLTSAGRVAYVAKMIPDASLRSAGSASRRASTTTMTDLSESAERQNHVANHITEPNNAATPTPASRTGGLWPNIVVIPGSSLVAAEERPRVISGADNDKNVAGTFPSENAALHVSQDTPVEDVARDTAIAGSNDKNPGKELAKQQPSSQVNPRYNGAKAFVGKDRTDVDRDSADMTELRSLLQKATEKLAAISRRDVHRRFQDLGQKYIESEANANLIKTVCEEMKAKIGITEAENADLKRQVQEARNMTDAKRDTIRNEVAGLKQELQKAKDKAEAECTAVQAENKALKKRLEQAEEKARSTDEAHKAQHDVLEEQLQAAMKEAESARGRAYEVEKKLKKKDKEWEELAGKLENMSKSLRA
ncbi:uncharacterized protein LTHEOB_4090 [Lasiodiplodia theobromae]|uniref:uncharacterized protein n=1 Tax=Lasiodiplodia theobromae TaxID=45133 RepID=UPI0015C3AD7A|nr:uncharacterized protein LTHEOB_4090 [Lasiodiplodia theobromae]KAF4546782.1 hypothetical protein LTHEOB_4090 [Lasiodiplodia theobromae]